MLCTVIVKLTALKSYVRPSLPLAGKNQNLHITVLPFFRTFAEIRNFCSPWKSPHMVFQLHEKNPEIIFFPKKKFSVEKNWYV